MNTLTQTAVQLCGVLLAMEFFSHLCEETELLRVVRGAAVLLLLASFLLSLTSLDLSLTLSQSDYAYGDSLTSLVESEVETAVQEEYTTYLEGLLAAAQLSAEKISLTTSKTDESSIVLHKVTLWFAYSSDAERAAALLRSVLGEEVEVETYVTA